MSTDHPSDIESVVRRGAHSGRVSYGDAIILHETSRTRVQMIPFFIPRSSGTDLAVKLVTYAKQPPPSDWAVVEEKSLSLQESAARKLLSALRTHLAVSEASGDGEYIVIRADQGTAEFGGMDSSAVATALTRVLSRPEIVRHLASTELTTELMSAFRGAIRLREMRSAVASLRTHLESGNTVEQTYQEWCKQHSWAFGNAYVVTDDTRDLSAGDRVDLLLPSVITGFRDIVELKRPDISVIMYDQAHRNYYFAAETSKAIGQVHRYLDVLHEEARTGLRDHPEVIAYHPRAIIVIGRSHNWQSEQRTALQGLNSRLAGITVMTYDHLLAQGERLIEVLTAEQGSLFDDQDTELSDFDDFPF